MEKLIDYAVTHGLTVSQAFEENRGKRLFFTPIMDYVSFHTLNDNRDFQVGDISYVEFVRLPERLEKEVQYKGSVEIKNFTVDEVFKDHLIQPVPKGLKFLDSIDGLYRVGSILQSALAKSGINITQAEEKMTRVMHAEFSKNGAVTELQKSFLQSLSGGVSKGISIQSVKFDLDNLFINYSGKLSISEPLPRKGDRNSLDEWVLWKVEEVGKTKADKMPYGFQARLIEEAQKYGYIDDSVIKRAFSRLGLSNKK